MSDNVASTLFSLADLKLKHFSDRFLLFDDELTNTIRTLNGTYFTTIILLHYRYCTHSEVFPLKLNHSFDRTRRRVLYYLVICDTKQSSSTYLNENKWFCNSFRVPSRENQ